jgi:polyphosphate glucokinase
MKRAGKRRAGDGRPGRGPARRVLVLDVGGTHVKIRMGAAGEERAFESGPHLTAKRMVGQVLELTGDWKYDVVSIGYPGIVFHGRITADPHNLGPGWIGFSWAKAFGKPVRVVNDAAMQAMGSYAGGRMLFLGLGTGLGATLIMNGIVEPMEIGHMPYKHGRTYEDYVGERGRRKLGTKKWRKVVAEVVDQLRSVLEVDYVVLGGGNTRRLRRLPKFARAGDNTNAFIGGLRLWERSGEDDPLTVPDKRGSQRKRRR